MPGYVYAVKDDVLYVNLFMTSSTSVDLAGRKVGIAQETRYPWDGTIVISVEPETEREFALRVRVPGWARNEPVPSDLYRFLDASAETPSLRINGTETPIDLRDGYAVLRRIWSKGDRVELRLPMPVRRVLAHESVSEDAGKVALQRGPLVYCAEGVDNGGKALDIVLPDAADFAAAYEPGLLNGVVILRSKTSRADGTTRDVALVPYYAWANRGAGEMKVWFPRR